MTSTNAQPGEPRGVPPPVGRVQAVEEPADNGGVPISAAGPPTRWMDRWTPRTVIIAAAVVAVMAGALALVLQGVYQLVPK